jgi:hypothetical protein
MAAITLEIGQELRALLSEIGQPVGTGAREMILLELYRRKLVSSGKAAMLLNMDRTDLIRRASESKIAFLEFSDEDWRAAAAESQEAS